MRCRYRLGGADGPFDAIVSRETRFALRPDDICCANIGQYGGKAFGDSGGGDWGLKCRSGLCFLWHKDDYCQPRTERRLVPCLKGESVRERRT